MPKACSKIVRLSWTVVGCDVSRQAVVRVRVEDSEVLRPLAQCPLTHRQEQVAEGSLGVHLSALYCLSSRFLKDPNGYSRDV